MKSLLWSGLAVAALAAMTAPAVLAQAHLTGNIPFAFTVNHTTLPAGSYSVQRVGVYWIFRGNDAPKSAAAVGVPKYSNQNDPAQLVFNCRADHCELREIQMGGGLVGYYVPQKGGRSNDAELARVVTVKLTQAD